MRVLTKEKKENLLGHSASIKVVEQQMNQKLKEYCPEGLSKTPGYQMPNISEIEWIYHNEIRTLSSPYSHYPRKISSQLYQWKQNITKSAYENGWSEFNPHIDTEGLYAPNVFDHFRMNGASRCRDIDLVIEQEDESGHPISRVFKQDEVVEIVKVTKHHRIPALDGQYAVRVKMNVPSNTVLGRFCGDEMFEFEYNKIYLHSCQHFMRVRYRMTSECPDNPWNGEKCPVHDGMGDIVSDELTTFPGNPMVIVNDPRKDISKPELTKEDKKYGNSYFRVIKINGWPSTVIVNSKPMVKGEEITIYYGEDYVIPPWVEKWEADFKRLKQSVDSC